ncbi:hypothetical protein ACF0BG_19495, partial [Acinetobacter baumannii]
MRRSSIRSIVISIIILIGACAIALAGLQVVRSKSRWDAANRVALSIMINRDLFVGLTQLQTELGWGISALAQEPAVNRTYRDVVRGSRQPFDTAVDRARAELSRMSDTASAVGTEEFRSLLETWRRVRTHVDVPFEQPVTDRAPSLAKTLDDWGGRVLATLEAASDATEAEIKALDPAFGIDLDARAATWRARVSAGRASNVQDELVATQRPVNWEGWTRLNTADTEART